MAGDGGRRERSTGWARRGQKRKEDKKEGIRMRERVGKEEKQ